MRRFTALFEELDRTTRTGRKVETLAAYFREAPPADAVWALALLTGRRGRRPVSTSDLRRWVADAAGLPLWLVEESYDAVGDLAETLALLLPERAVGVDVDAAAPPSPPPCPPPLHRVIEEWVLPLRGMDAEAQEAALHHAWRHLSMAERFLFHKLITGGFRVGVGEGLVIRGLSEASGIPAPILAHRLAGQWDPTPETFADIVNPASDAPDPGRPYPFMLAHPIPDPVTEAILGPTGDWLLEWKWDGVRAQLLHRAGEVLIWSRGQEVFSETFPEVVAAGRALPDGTVLDGEIVAWDYGTAQPLSFADLQRRLGRKNPSSRIQKDVPVRFLAYDLLEKEGRDLRHEPLRTRRARLEELLGADGTDDADDADDAPLAILSPSPRVIAPSWGEAMALRDTARARGVEGLMLKALDSPYEGGRPRGRWWKWKVDPLTLDAVLLYAKKGHGRRASRFTDYTFGVWDGETLVPVASAYSGLTDAEFATVDRWIRGHITERFGPVRAVEPMLVFELAFEGIRPSSRHRAGLALRFPRMVRWREDKTPADADTLAALHALLAGADAGGANG
jgi:DNA ligase 1